MYDTSKKSISDVFTLIKSTWDTPYISVKQNTYATFKKKFDSSEIDHTDGIGTKASYHWNKKTFQNAVIDSLAMNLNDLLLVRATAYKLQNHIVLPNDDPKVINEILQNLVKECKKRQIAITGGETSIHNFPESFDIGITISGFIKKEIKNKAQVGDVVIGFRSNGLHSNGFTLIRKLFKEFRDEFIKPTKIYYDDLLEIAQSPLVHGMMHITGGAFTKLHGIIGKDMDIVIDKKPKLKPHDIFYETFNKGVGNSKMYSTFNCGIGFLMTVDKKYYKKILESIDYAEQIGEVVDGNGVVKVASYFDGETILV